MWLQKPIARVSAAVPVIILVISVIDLLSTQSRAECSRNEGPFSCTLAWSQDKYLWPGCVRTSQTIPLHSHCAYNLLWEHMKTIHIIFPPPDNPLIWKGLSPKTVSGIVHLPVVPLVCVHDLTCMVLHLHCLSPHSGFTRTCFQSAQVLIRTEHGHKQDGTAVLRSPWQCQQGACHQAGVIRPQA